MRTKQLTLRGYTSRFQFCLVAPDLHLAAQPPVQAFDGRTAKPSAKNCIIVSVETGEQMLFVRKVDGYEFNIDAKPSLPPLMLYAFVLALNICRI
jgi:hypothetical protein